MIAFKDYVKTFKKKYVALHFTKDSEENLRSFAQDNGFDITQKFSGEKITPGKFKFHTTVFYTTSVHDTQNGKYDLPGIKLALFNFKLLGPNQNIPVLLVNPKPLLDIRKKFEEMGYEDEWPAYQPHVTLSYNYDGTPDLKTLRIPDFAVETSHIIIEDQND